MKNFLRLAGSLLLVFLISFFLSGGHLPFSSEQLSPLKEKLPPLSLPATSKEKNALPSSEPASPPEDGSGNAGALQRVSRFVFLPQAVSDRLRRANYTKIDWIAPDLKNAIIAVEDSRFYSHIGIDLTAIARAALVNLQYGEVTQGGSTITQQLVKTLFLSQEQTIDRKIEEVMLALNLEARCSKDEILEYYLNSIYFGSGFYGITDAASGYFGKTPGQLTLPEAAMLAGLPNAPSLYSPYEDFTLAKKRQFIVLDAMVKNGFISAELADDAKRAPLILAR